MPLSDTKIRNAKPAEKAFKLHDEGGLFLLVNPNGSKLWRLKFRLPPLPGEKRSEQLMALGKYPEVSLADARTARDEARKLIAKGIHPVEHRKREMLLRRVEDNNTFEAIAREWIADRKKNWTAYYLGQVERSLQRNLFPELGDLPIRMLETHPGFLLQALQKVHDRGAEVVAYNLRQWCSAIFRYAIVTMRADTDPAAALKGALTKPKTNHHPTLSRAEIPEFLAAVDGYTAGYSATRIALKLLLYVFVRPGELRQAEWVEFDLAAGEWRVPAERMKMRRLHVVPLPRQAIALLEELRLVTGGGPLLFPNMRDRTRCMTMTTLNRALERMGYAGRLSSHGFRGTASTILHELGYRPEVIERQLAHAPRDMVAASYNHYEYMAERRAMLQEWADFIDGLVAGGEKVVPVRRA